MKEISQPLSNVQLELLRAFSFNLNQNDLKEFKTIIAQYFAKKAISEADKVWDTNQWNEQSVEKMLNTKMRKAKKQ